MEKLNYQLRDARGLPELDESLMQEQGHEVPGHVVALSRQK
jgi:hypothetical protein